MTHFRPPPPKPMRLNHVALLLAGALALVTIAVVLWSAVSCTHTRGRDAVADSATVAQRVVPRQHPAYPIAYRIDSSAVRGGALSAAPGPVARTTTAPPARAILTSDPPRAWRSALAVPAAPHDTVAPQAAAAVASPYVLLSGAMITASLVTEIRSTLPGLDVAVDLRDD